MLRGSHDISASLSSFGFAQDKFVSRRACSPLSFETKKYEKDLTSSRNPLHY